MEKFLWLLSSKGEGEDKVLVAGQLKNAVFCGFHFEFHFFTGSNRHVYIVQCAILNSTTKKEQYDKAILHAFIKYNKP